MSGTSKLTRAEEIDFDFRGPEGEILQLENVVSIRAISLNKLENKKDTYFVDLIDINGNFKKNYTCSYNCLNFTITMLFAESDAEDKKIVNVSFESLVAFLATTRNLGFEDATKTMVSEFEEDPDEELIKRELTTLLH